MAENVNGKLLQGTDELINNQFNYILWNYVNGDKTKEEALDYFRKQVANELSEESLKRLRLILN